MSDTIKCPFCAEEIKAEAKKCKHCGEWLTDEAKAQTGGRKVFIPEVVEGTKKQVRTSTFSDGAWGCGTLIIVIVLIWGGFNLVRSWFTGAETTVVATENTQKVSNGNINSSQDESERETVREQLEDPQLQSRVYETCQNQEGLLAQPDVAKWPDLAGGLFSGMRRSVDVDDGTLTLRAAVDTRDEFDGEVEAIVECVYTLTQNSTIAQVTRTSEASTYPVVITVKPDGYKADLAISRSTDTSSDRITGSTGYKSDRSFELKPGAYSYRVSLFGFQTSTGTFQVPSKKAPTITLIKLPTADVTFTSTPEKIMVNIPDVGAKMTPFTVPLPKDVDIAYSAYSPRDDEYARKIGSLKVTEKQNYAIKLEVRPVLLTFTSLPDKVKVDIPGEVPRTTPFTLSVPANKVLNYRAFSEDRRYKSKQGSVNVGTNRSQTHRITLVPDKVNVTFTSKPKGVRIALPYMGTRTTPFTVSLFRNTNVIYRAFVKDSEDYESKSGTLNFAEDTTHKIVLARARAEEAKRPSNQQPQQPTQKLQQQEPSSAFTPTFVKAYKVGADNYLFEVNASYDFDKIDCGSGIENDLRFPDIYGVQCFYTSFGREKTRQFIDIDIQYGRDNGWMAYFSGWVQEDDGSLTGYIDNYDEEDTAARLYIIPAEGGGTYITAYSLYQ